MTFLILFKNISTNIIHTLSEGQIKLKNMLENQLN